MAADSGGKAEFQSRDRTIRIIRKPMKTNPSDDRLFAGCNNNAPVLGISQKHLVSVQVAETNRDQSGPNTLSKPMVIVAANAVSAKATNSFPEMFVIESATLLAMPTHPVHCPRLFP